MFTREELFEYFSDRYTPTQIIAILHKLAEEDQTLDPEALEFPAAITDRLEAAFKIVEMAIAQQKTLAGTAPQTESDLAQIEKLAIDMAVQSAINIPIEILPSIVEIVAGEEVARAAAISRMRDAVFRHALSEMDAKRFEQFSQESAENIQLILRLVNDPQKLKQILGDYGLKSNDEVVTEFQALTSTCTVDFDPDAFLEEVTNGKKLEEIPENSRAVKPKTLADTKAMVKALVSQSLR